MIFEDKIKIICRSSATAAERGGSGDKIKIICRSSATAAERGM